MVCRVKVDAPAGIVELEGEAQFVTDFFDKFLPLIQAAGFGSAPPPSDTANADSVGNGGSDNTEQKSKIKRRKRPNPPAGSSCRARILTLKDDGFFKGQRTVSDIVAGLAKKGWVHNGNQVGAAVVQMFNKDEIQRTNDGGGFTYYWDRD